MKKLSVIILFTLFLAIGGNVRAQEPAFEMGDKVVNLGVGFGSASFGGLYYSTGVPPVSISYEQAFMDEVLEEGVIGLGGYAGYSSYRWRANYLGADWGWNYSNFVLAALGSFHYPLVDDLDTYAGVLMGYRISIDSEYGDIPGGESSVASGGIVFSGFIGGRYYFSDNFAAFAQVGYGISYLTLGVSFKL